MKLSEMKQILAESELRLTRSLGQNFLHDANQLRRIVEAAELTNADKALEIGPGLGPLTELLVARAGEVLAIEKDRRLVELLRRRFGLESRLQPVGRTPTATPETGTLNLHLLHDDALEFLRREPRDWSGWKLVANLPYSVASSILVELAQNRGRPERMVVTLQLEVARRLMAGPGAEDYGVLTLLLQLHYAPQRWFKISASCFFPEPDVESACVVLLRRPKPLLSREHADVFTKLVKRSFSQRRKMMLKLLKADWAEEQLIDAFTRLQLRPQARAENVNLEEYVQLARLLRP